MNIQLALADDHPMIIEGIRNMLASYKQLNIIADYNSGRSLMEGLASRQPDVLLLDLHFPDINGADLVKMILPAYPQLKILVLTSIEDPFVIQELIKEGCSGYVRKTADKSLLAEAIITVFQGDTFLEPALKDALMRIVLSKEMKNLAKIKLTVREREIMELICEGYTNMDIAKKLFLSHRTVEHHRLTLYAKFSVTNTASLVRVAIQHKFIR